MIIGLLGAHRTGKTTLAKAVASVSGIRYMEVKLSAAQRILGFDSSNQNYSFKERRTIQEGLLSYMAQLLAACGHTPTIFDRTPLDLIGYTISLANANVLDQEDEEWLKAFIENCHLLTAHYFNYVHLVQPGIPLESNKTSAVAEEGYIRHLNYIYLGVLAESSTLKHTVIPAWMTDLQTRVNHVMKY